jgi:hypothetical protein
MMLDNATYNKVKLLHNLSAIYWFLEKHALIDAQNAGDKESVEAFKALQRDIEKHIEKMQKAMCIITQ